MKNFDFKDINLIPKMGIVESRADIEISTINMHNMNFKLPIVPANMSSVITTNMCQYLADNGYFYIMHRFDINILDFAKDMRESGRYISISLGVKDSDKEIVKRLVDLKPEFITVDIAHGHSVMMKSMIEVIKEYLPDTYIIAGNVSTPQAVVDLEDWGVDMIKVGIAPGFACTTAFQTGFGSRDMQASTLLECVSRARKSKIMIDGGIKTPSDVTKSLVLGADFIMSGSMMCGLIESPGKIIEIDGKEYKEYWGSASNKQTGKTNRIEGKFNPVPYKNITLEQHLINLTECLQSSISYGGGEDLNSLKYVRINNLK